MGYPWPCQLNPIVVTLLRNSSKCCRYIQLNAMSKEHSQNAQYCLKSTRDRYRSHSARRIQARARNYANFA